MSMLDAGDPAGNNQIQAVLQSLAQAINAFNTDSTTNTGTLNTTLTSVKTALERGSSTYPTGATLTNATATGANATLTPTLAAVAAKTTYISGFDITSTGSTLATVVQVSVTNTIGSSLVYTYVSVAGATALNAPLSIRFPAPIPATAANTPITVTLPALGAGNTNATVSVYGFQL